MGRRALARARGALNLIVRYGRVDGVYETKTKLILLRLAPLADLLERRPAPERLVQRKRPAEICVVEETAEAYDRVVRPFVEAQAAKIGWIDAVCALEKERERNLHACDAFVVNVDTKWSTHGPFEDDRATWRPAWKSTSVSGA